MRKEVDHYFREKEQGKEQKQEFGFDDVLEDLISGDLLTFTHSDLIPEYQAHSGSYSAPTYLPYHNDGNQAYGHGYGETGHMDVDL